MELQDGSFDIGKEVLFKPTQKKLKVFFGK
jgi:hypothetical protein